MLSPQQIFDNLLPHLWLRPERALWDAIELGAVSKILLPNLKSPSMEYGCTDGLNTFTMLGGKMNFEYDDYVDISDVQIENDDLENGDFFEAMPKDIQPKITCFPIIQFDLGLSWKYSHLKRAKRLGVYKELNIMQFDKIDSMNFGKFSTIWAPQLFWTNENFIFDKLIDLRSMLNFDGNLVTILPVESQKLEDINQKLKFPPTVQKTIDKGISFNICKNARSHVEWENIFDKAGLKVVEQIEFIDPIVSRFYQLGFRPMFRPLLKMYSILRNHSPHLFFEFKKNWIGTLHHFIDPLISRSSSKNFKDRSLWIAYRLQPKH